MKAAVFKGPFKFAIEDRPMPEPGLHEVLVKIKAVGICGSDLHGFAGLIGKRRMPGLVMGHEASGVVAACGKGAVRWKEGGPGRD